MFVLSILYGLSMCFYALLRFILFICESLCGYLTKQGFTDKVYLKGNAQNKLQNENVFAIFL